MGQIALQLTQKDQSAPQILPVTLALILTIVMAVALGLAVDTTKMFFVYDNLQDATNTIVMNAASTLCAGADAEDAAIQALALNPVVHSMNNVNITIANPPPAGTLNAGNSNYVYVELTGEKSNYYNQLIHGEPLAVSATATATCGG